MTTDAPTRTVGGGDGAILRLDHVVKRFGGLVAVPALIAVFSRWHSFRRSGRRYLGCFSAGAADISIRLDGDGGGAEDDRARLAPHVVRVRQHLPIRDDDTAAGRASRQLRNRPEQDDGQYPTTDREHQSSRSERRGDPQCRRERHREGLRTDQAPD